ncbi:helix-turn-helix transcriptional regulator [Sellimonas intestinalis]|uniref:helix-turn-helix domain-containing protein n=1 Tax=Sellimonas intestinalis TaxID=1653434 RepID=UPI002943B132|nr:helix-turn-helix transcriptional regulator [Sellimonas intestinalis]
MTLKDRVKTLAQERGISLPTLEAELGFGNSTIVKWDKSTPNADKLNAVAKYFGVTMDYLLNGINNTKLTEKDERDIAKDLDRIMGEIQKGDDGPLYYNGTEIDQASLSLLQNAIEYALRETKKENKEKYNPNKNKK